MKAWNLNFRNITGNYIINFMSFYPICDLGAKPDPGLMVTQDLRISSFFFTGCLGAVSVCGTRSRDHESDEKICGEGLWEQQDTLHCLLGPIQSPHCLIFYKTRFKIFFSFKFSGNDLPINIDCVRLENS